MGHRSGGFLLQHGRHRHHLGGGAGFEGVLEGRVAQRVRVGVGEVARVEAGRVGYGEDLAGGRVLDDDVAAVRLGLLHLPADGVLGGPLDVAVDGEFHVAAGDGGRLGGTGGGYLAAAGLRVADLAVLAGQGLVQLPLQAAAALAVRADPAEDAGGEVAARVHALAAGVGKDAREDVDHGLVRLRLLGQRGLQVLDLVPDLRSLPAGEADVAQLPVLRAEHVDQVLLVLADDGREERRRLLGTVADLQLLAGEHRGVGGDVVGVHGAREGDAVAVGDRAALGGQRV